jgi:hypothetical protein
VSTRRPDRLRATVGALLRGLVDDAAVFPPGNATVPAAVTEHRLHRRAWYGDLVGPLLLRPAQVPEMLDAAAPGDDLDVGVVADANAGLAGLMAGAHALLDQDDRAHLVQAEVALPSGHDPATATRVLVDQLALSVPTYVEVPRTGFEGALDVLADDGAERAKYRTGGTAAGAVPSSAELAGFLRAALDRRLSVKLTAGLHHAVRGPLDDPDAQHGVLNVLAAVGAGVDGADAAAMARLLDTVQLDPLLGVLDGVDVPAVRRSFVSFGCCGVTDPVGELVALGLLDGDEEQE